MWVSSPSMRLRIPMRGPGDLDDVSVAQLVVEAVVARGLAVAAIEDRLGSHIESSTDHRGLEVVGDEPRNCKSLM